jgi:molybdenum cofactor biosynthesis enzyme
MRGYGTDVDYVQHPMAVSMEAVLLMAAWTAVELLTEVSTATGPPMEALTGAGHLLGIPGDEVSFLMFY